MLNVKLLEEDVNCYSKRLKIAHWFNGANFCEFKYKIKVHCELIIGLNWKQGKRFYSKRGWHSHLQNECCKNVREKFDMKT